MKRKKEKQHKVFFFKYSVFSIYFVKGVVSDLRKVSSVLTLFFFFIQKGKKEKKHKRKKDKKMTPEEESAGPGPIQISKVEYIYGTIYP